MKKLKLNRQKLYKQMKAGTISANYYKVTRKDKRLTVKQIVLLATEL